MAGSPRWPIAVLVGGVTLVAHAMLFALVGAPWAPGAASEQAARPTEAAPEATATPAPTSSPSLPPSTVLLPSGWFAAGHRAETFPAVIPAIVEREDGVGDVEYWECGAGACRQIDPPADAAVLDITHLAAWIDDDVMHAEVRLAGSPPSRSDPGTAWGVALQLTDGERYLATCVGYSSAEVGSLCTSSVDLARATSTVASQPNEWIVAWQIDLGSLIDVRTGRSEGDEAQPGGTLGVEVWAWTVTDSGELFDSTTDGLEGHLAVPWSQMTCPPGSDPDLPGPADQARPRADFVSMTFDREAGQIVLLATDPVATGATETTETWTFDVCSNRWFRRSGAGAPERALLAYDRDSRAVVAFAPQYSGGEPVYASVFGRTTEGWSRRSAAPLQQLLGVVYEPRSGQIVVHGRTAETADPELWAYDVDRDSWTRVRQVNAPDLGADPQHELLAYDPRRQRIVLHLIDRSWEYYPPSGWWSVDRASSPPVNGGFFGVPGAIATDEATGRVVVYSAGQVLAYEGEGGRWAPVQTLADWPDPDDRYGQSIVYDPLNQRFVVYGGQARRDDVWSTTDDVVALDPSTGTWITLVPPTKQ